jgi:hypothetical protein
MRREGHSTVSGISKLGNAAAIFPKEIDQKGVLVRIYMWNSHEITRLSLRAGRVFAFFRGDSFGCAGE